jgi:hypothetical protein
MQKEEGTSRSLCQENPGNLVNSWINQIFTFLHYFNLSSNHLFLYEAAGHGLHILGSSNIYGTKEVACSALLYHLSAIRCQPTCLIKFQDKHPLFAHHKSK